MEFESVYTITELEKLGSLKELIYTIKELKSEMIISSLRYENIGDEIIVFFRIDRDSYTFMVEKLIFNNIRMLIVDQRNKDLMESIQNKIHLSNNDFIGWGSSKSVTSARKTKTVEELVENGNYREIIRLSKNISTSSTIVEKAKNNISNAVFVAIDTIYQDGLRSQIEIDNSVNRLLEIASDRNLRILNKLDEMKQAGYMAIELCAQNKDYYGDLIHIANLSALPNIINIKAAIRFTQLILSDPDTFKDEITTAIKKLNTRWLGIAMDTVRKDISEEEIIEFEKLNSVILEKRKAT
jgi:hypothetical protein